MKTKKFLFYLLAALLGGCVPVMSLHPLFTKEDVAFDEKLVGTWVDDSNNTWEFKSVNNPPNPIAYELTFREGEDKKGSFLTYLVELENELFLDICPNKLPCEQQDLEKMAWPYNVFFLLPLHTFIKVDTIEPQLRMQLTDDDEMKKLLVEEPNAVKHELDGDTIILTASTKELQAFVLKYADDSRVFGEKSVLTRKKIKDPNCIEPNETEPNSIDPNEG